MENPNSIAREHDNTLIPVCPLCECTKTSSGITAQYMCENPKCLAQFNEHKLISEDNNE